MTTTRSARHLPGFARQALPVHRPNVPKTAASPDESPRGYAPAPAGNRRRSEQQADPVVPGSATCLLSNLEAYRHNVKMVDFRGSSNRITKSRAGFPSHPLKKGRVSTRFCVTCREAAELFLSTERSRTDFLARKRLSVEKTLIKSAKKGASSWFPIPTSSTSSATHRSSD